MNEYKIDGFRFDLLGLYDKNMFKDLEKN
jgi:pullulanase/glycogen debranching enzyme